MHVTPQEKRDLRVGKSRNGNGIFAKRAFKPHERIFQVTGTRIACNEDDDIDEETRSNTYRFDEDLYISPQERMGDFLNHSCNPNAKVAKAGQKLFVEAITLIPSGKEVTIDYSTILAADDSWKMKCNCGSKKCRVKVGKFKSLPPEIKKAYIRRGIVPAYILELDSRLAKRGDSK